MVYVNSINLPHTDRSVWIEINKCITLIYCYAPIVNPDHTDKTVQLNKNAEITAVKMSAA